MMHIDVVSPSTEQPQRGRHNLASDGSHWFAAMWCPAQFYFDDELTVVISGGVCIMRGLVAALCWGG